MSISSAGTVHGWVVADWENSSGKGEEGEVWVGRLLAP